MSRFRNIRKTFTGTRDNYVWTSQKKKKQGKRLQSSHISQNSSYNIISHSRNLSHIMERTSLIAVYVFFIVLDIVV